MRIGPHQIGTAGATLGDGLVFDPDVDEVVYGPVVQGLTSDDSSVTISDNGDGTFDLAAAGGGGSIDPTTTLGDLIVNDGSGLDRLGVGSNGDVLTADSSQPLGMKWDTPAGGGGASGFPLDPTSLHATYGDHFTGASLAAKWNRVSYVAGDEQYAKGGGTYLQIDVPRAAGSYYYQAAPAGDFTVVLKATIVKGGAVMFGPLILDNSGNGVAAVPYNAPDAMLIASVAAGVYGNTSQQDAGSIHGYASAGTVMWYRLNKTGTVYKASVSANGYFWRPWTPTLSSAITPTRIGFGSILGTARQIAVDFFDVQ